MNRKTVLTCAAAGVLCLASLLLPDVTLAARDRAMRSRVESVETDEVALSLLTELTVGQKLTLAGDASATDIPLAAGKVLDGDGVKARVREMVEYEIIPEDMDYTLESSATLRVGADGSALILWRAELYGADWSMSMLLDDSTGAVLACSLRVWEETDAAPDADNSEIVRPGDAYSEPMDPAPDYGLPSFDYQDPAMMFLSPLGLKPAGYTFSDTDPGTAFVHLNDGPDIPVTFRVEWPEVYISVNMG